MHHITNIFPGCLLLSGNSRTFVKKITKGIDYVRCLGVCYPVDFPCRVPVAVVVFPGHGGLFSLCVQYRLEEDRQAEQEKIEKAQGKEKQDGKRGIEGVPVPFAIP